MNKQRLRTGKARTLTDNLITQRERDVLIRSFLESLDTPVSLGIWLRYLHDEHLQIAQIEINPASYNCEVRFRDDYAAVSLLRKASFLRTKIRKDEVALKEFSLREEQCALTNKRLSKPSLETQQSCLNVTLLSAMNRKIRLWLEGPHMKQSEGFSVDEWLDCCRWGPGVTQSIKGEAANSSVKFLSDGDITSSARRVFLPVMRCAYPNWTRLWQITKVVDFNEVITVPKNAKTDRTIAVEPGLNSWIQLGLGRMLRKRILKQGFNLNSTDFNSRMAREGSKFNLITTVDFSSASDTISRVLVEQLLPKTWFQVLDAARSPGYKLKGEIKTYSKFSAMGNGFTWELECLIFVVAALVCCEHLGLPTDKVGVFGDDITLPTEAYPLYCELSEFLGFTVNTRKSYASTYFRESCGSYYFKGLDCKPLFLQKDIKNVQELFNLANRVRSLAHNRNHHYGCDFKLLPTWTAVVRRIPEHLRYLIPENAGSYSGIFANFDEATTCRTSNVRYDHRGWEGFHFSQLRQYPVNVSDDSSGHLLAMLARLRKMPTKHDAVYTGNDIPLRGTVKTRKARGFTALWHNFGPWF